MHAEFLNICLIAAVLPCLTLASSYTPCTTAEQCKSSMKHEFKMQYYEAFTHALRETVNAIQNAAVDLEKGLPADNARRVQLEGIKDAAQQQHEMLDGLLDDDKLVSIYQTTQQYWRQLRSLNTEDMDIKSHKNRAKAEMEKMHKAVFNMWTSAGKLRGDIEVPGFDEIDKDVQRAKDTAITDENMEFIIGTFTRAMNFYELRKLNVFTFM